MEDRPRFSHSISSDEGPASSRGTNCEYVGYQEGKIVFEQRGQSGKKPPRTHFILVCPECGSARAYNGEIPPQIPPICGQCGKPMNSIPVTVEYREAKEGHGPYKKETTPFRPKERMWRGLDGKIIKQALRIKNEPSSFHDDWVWTCPHCGTTMEDASYLIGMVRCQTCNGRMMLLCEGLLERFCRPRSFRTFFQRLRGSERPRRTHRDDSSRSGERKTKADGATESEFNLNPVFPRQRREKPARGTARPLVAGSWFWLCPKCGRAIPKEKHVNIKANCIDCNTKMIVVPRDRIYSPETALLP